MHIRTCFDGRRNIKEFFSEYLKVVPEFKPSPNVFVNVIMIS